MIIINFCRESKNSHSYINPLLEHIKIDDILFLDIETVPAWPSFGVMPDSFRTLWEKKAVNLCKEGDTPESIYNRTGIFAEFGKVVCVSTGMAGQHKEGRALKLKSFFGEDEKSLLEALADLLIRLCRKKEILLCAHNGKEFDFPFLARRMLIQRVSLPAVLDMAGKRPWETRYLDTLDLWKFGDHKHYTSLDLLATAFGLESPKADMDGSQVAGVYWRDRDLKRIWNYCCRDVITVAQLMFMYKGITPLSENEIVNLDE
jgi:hypothetical protein